MPQESYQEVPILVPLFPGEAMEEEVRLAPGTYAKGTLLAALGPLYVAYRPGLEAQRVLKCSCQVDSGGRVTLGAASGAGTGPPAVQAARAPAYKRGTFACEELVGLDEQAARALGRLVQGEVTRGILRIA
jgi:hypothetical protein